MFTAGMSTTWRKSLSLQNDTSDYKALLNMRRKSFQAQTFEIQKFILNDLRHPIKKKISVLLSCREAETVQSKIRKISFTDFYPSGCHQPVQFLQNLVEIL